DVEVLARAVSGPTGDVEDERPNAWGLVDDLGDLRRFPGQSPQYRCSSHGSPRMWYPFDSQKPGSSSSRSSNPRTHFALFQKYRCGTSRRTGPPCSSSSGSVSYMYATHALPSLTSSRPRFVVSPPSQTASRYGESSSPGSSTLP